MARARITVEEAITDLREQLQRAAVAGANAPIRFVPKTVEVELCIAVNREMEGKASGGLWSLIDISGKTKIGDEATHKIKLVLEPVDQSGKPALISSSIREPD